MKSVSFYLIVLLFTSLAAFGQHEHHEGMKMDEEMEHDTTSHTMSHAFSQSLPMNRNGSGTGWLPDQTPMYAWMKHGNKWMYMMHGAIFIRGNFQNVNNDYRSGGKQFDAPTWLMAMAQRKTGRNGLFLFRAMMSLDPFTVGNSGYPLLFQSGELYKGVPLVNRQHPHDLFSELAVGYTQKISSDLDVSVYLAYPGEPALGPTAFMHRISSLNNPDAPLGHHWQDATHITFGVATLGIRYKKFKLEGSSFTGREPDEHRYGFDKPRFDSYSGRLSFAPSDNFILQASRAFITQPEEELDDVNRTTFSVIYARRISQKDHVTATAVWGLNEEAGHPSEQSFLAESNYQHNRLSIYGRYELVQKSPLELQFVYVGNDLLTIHALTLGSNYQLGTWFRANTAIGLQATVNKTPSAVEFAYGKTPISMEAYLRFVPSLLN